MIKTHKIKMYPNDAMRKVLNSLFDYRRYCYNLALEVWNDMYDESLLMNNKALRPNECKVRDELVFNKMDWQYYLSARVLQFAVSDLAQAWQNFFNPKMKQHNRPKFKSSKKSRHIFKTDRAKLICGKLRLDKPHQYREDWCDIRLAEQVRWEGKLKLAIITEEADGYYVSLAIKVVDQFLREKTKQMTGVDVNIGKFNYKAKNGYRILKTLPPQLVGLYRRVANYQRILARKRKVNSKNFDSKQYRKTRAKLKRCYQKITRIQMDMLHKFIAQLVTANDVIAIEDLNNTCMKMNRHMAKSLHRAMFGKFKKIMQYKCKWCDVKLVLVDCFYPSTQRCSCCGNIKKGTEKIGLSGNAKYHTKHHEYHCYKCGVKLNRDENAVENLIQYI